MIYTGLVLAIVVGLAFLLRPWPLFPAAEEEESSTEMPDYRNVALDFGRWVERQAHLHGLRVRGVARPVQLECRKCRKSSNFFVYPDDLCETCWRASLQSVPRKARSRYASNHESV